MSKYKWCLFLVTMIVVVALMVLVSLTSSLGPKIVLWVSERKGMLKINSWESLTLSGCSTNDYERITISKYRDGHCVSKELASASKECQECVAKWLLSEHTKAMPSCADFAPDLSISFVAKDKSQSPRMAVVTLLEGFAITYDYGTNQFLRLLTDTDRQLMRTLTLEFGGCE